MGFKAMQEISREDVLRRIRFENPWWKSEAISDSYEKLTPRAYFKLFYPLVIDRSVRRAVILMGPRRVGKTVMIHHTVRALIEDGVPPKHICYISVDHPIYNGLGVDQLVQNYRDAIDTDLESEPLYVFFDEIQYLKNWEVHLKAFIDAYPNIKVVASGSAAAALRLKSGESGAGRFTDFLLPPLTFYEYMDLLGVTDILDSPAAGGFFGTSNIEALNARFVHYLNFGGYPEVLFSPQIQADPARFVKSDIIDKVLLRDLPSLYGIGDIQELNYLFTTLAFNTADEMSLERLSQTSGVAKNTIKKYIEYLEAAFLLKVVHRVGRSARRFTRANFFKVYLTNPSMRAALFSPIKMTDKAMPYLVETAVFSQWFHSAAELHYARWNDGEVDLVMLGAEQKPAWVGEVKWSDRFCDRPEELRSLTDFCRANSVVEALVTSKTQSIKRTIGGVQLNFVPASIYCYTVGFNLIQGRNEIREDIA